MTSLMTTGALFDTPYAGYLYAYPHKTAYRPFSPKPALADLWADERREAVFGYLHVPFCEMRCGFCNLFTRTGAPDDVVDAYLDQLSVQADRVTAAVGPIGWSSLAIGGGTPTYLDPRQLGRLFDVLDRHGIGGGSLSVETSPATATADRIGVLAERGTTRISIGIQSFLDDEAHAAGRPQKAAEVDRALQVITGSGVDCVNLDLIYGIDGQTPATWLTSLQTAIAWRPQEIFCYPLYVRPLTGLGGRVTTRADWDADRLELYRMAVEVLGDAGYQQDSMRLFRHRDHAAPQEDYCCQDDPMIGLGCGARSYTSTTHYSFDYAVGIRQVRRIIDDYLARPAVDFDRAEVGYVLDPDEQRRRWVIKSLLKTDGIDLAGYAARFGGAVTDDLDLEPLAAAGMLVTTDTPAGARLRLTADGLAWSDAIGPWLTSARVRRQMREHVPR